MKHGRLFHLAPMVWALCCVIFILSGITWFFDPIVSYIELGTAVLCLVGCIIYTANHQRIIDRYMRRVLKHIDESDQQSLSRSPLPIVAITSDGQVLWHNAFFEMQVTGGQSVKGIDASALLPNLDMASLYKNNVTQADVLGRHYLVYVSVLNVKDTDVFLLYYIDVTKLHADALEYHATRPMVLLIQIDNLEEVMRNMRSSERARIAGQVENCLEDWLSPLRVILRKYDDDRFIAIVEKRYLAGMIEERFSILDRVRSVMSEQGSHITLSIGIGEGIDFHQAEKLAQQAMDMALGRGGDQAALKTKNGFEFYGGLSKGVEKRTKVRTRVMAATLQDLILSSDNVLVMGHRFSDLDSVGSGLALTQICRSLGKKAHLVVSRQTTLAEEVFVRLEKADRGDIIVSPEHALPMIDSKTLLIITDTQITALLESKPLYEAIHTVAVIDHHRKMVDHIDKAVLFYHESYASSACEMVTELVQYMDVPEFDPFIAEALLAGIMLDTRNFVLKAGVRTFEAAAYLRKLGADTVSVKKIFSGSMEGYRRKTDIVSSAQFYRETAIAYATQDGCGQPAQLRIACSQAADELLSVKDVHAAFALFEDNGAVNISARSYGDVNVQLIMEFIGGGGHMTMAGAQLKGITMDNAINHLKQAIDRYYQENTTV